MTAVDSAERRVKELQALLVTARERVPSLRRATHAVGAPGSWTGTAAHRLHHDELVLLSGRLAHRLERAEDAVLEDLQHARRALSRAQDEQEAVERKSTT
ncbi:hypothetical protein [Cellulomonas sp. KH9]|uniref:hypothetical protein n=1 Tax=Cellulomonas sp. KH9 TaxID=1855324 RepID=UPI0008E12C7F|nr:hypothetical protein [Cellulomonas sp. KH9]SFJ63437.1 hypothetical protein SAMN05216467_0270 [Cellulomonas sp. KH9]